MKRALWTIILLAALGALGLAAQRWMVEVPNRTVELVYDLPGLLELSGETGVPVQDYLAQLKDAGIATIAVQPESLGERLLKGGGVPPEVQNQLPEELTELGRFLTLPLAFDQSHFVLVEEAGLKAAPKLNTAPWEVEPLWRPLQPELIIVSGQGLFSLEQLEGTGAVTALVEFATPQFENLDPSSAVRLHGISAREMDVLSTERILNRYLRAVRERNLRVLYLRPFSGEAGGWERSLELLDQLKSRLSRAGFNLGTAQPFAPWNPSLVWTAVVAAGIWAAAVLYGGLLFPHLARLVLAGGALGYLGTLLFLVRSPLTGKQGLALLAAVVFPALSLQVQGGKTPLVRYLSTAGVSLLGALFVVGSLTGTEFLVKLAEFRGVKLMHILPILLVIFSLARPLSAWLQKEVPVPYLLAAGFVGLAGMVYLLRTGNFGLPVPDLEVKIRESLENLLRVRPRTKELFLGHPALYLVVHSKEPKKSWLLPLAVIGQLSLVNTFTHTHTFLGVSLLRTVYGLVFGWFVGWAVLRLYQLGKRWLRDSSIRVLRVR